VVPAPPPQSRPLCESASVAQRFAALERHVHPIALGARPTPIRAYEALGDALGVPRLYVKHDDSIAPEYGGGKIRKLSYFLGEALHQGHTSVVTTGAVGSHHAVATAVHGRRFGLDCTLLLIPSTPTSEVCSNLLGDLHAGARIELAGGPAAAARAIERLRQETPAPYVIPVGGTSPLGNLGYLDAALELEAQVESGVIPPPDVVVVALGTMGTAVGLTLGLELTQLDTAVMGVRVSNLATSTEARFRAELDRTRQWLAERGASIPAPRAGRWSIEPGYLGRGYAVPTRDGERAVALAAANGLRLETTYTGKAMAAIAGSGRRLRGATVVFWHTHSAVDAARGDAAPKALRAEFREYCR
jgi:1-aminocyclopropane-1-carboxylate deaminase/D-cysteine desulfhydrase-like pyridoxal-dependent ACC family enzyme